MVFNETYLLRQLQYALGSKLFNCFDQEYFIDILKMKTLVLYSTYYPKLIRGVRITKDCAIPTIDPKTGMTNYYRYKIPKFDPEDEYIGIERWIFNGQGYEQAAAGMGGIAADAIYSKIRSMLPIPPVRWRATFEAPDFCEVFPYRVNHDDFVLVMQRLVRLTEIPSGLWESFTELFIADVKLAIYNEFPAARNSGVLNGVEIDTNISEFSNAESKRDEIKELFNKNYCLNPDRFEALNIAGFA